MTTLFFTLCLVLGLATLSWIDIKTFRLLDSLTFPLIGLGILQAWILGHDVFFAAIGAIAGYSVFVIIAYAFKSIRGKDGLGRGDAKLFAVGGAWCGLAALPQIALIASLSGIAMALFPYAGKRFDKGWIPFGPYLSLGILVTYLLSQYGTLK